MSSNIDVKKTGETKKQKQVEPRRQERQQQLMRPLFNDFLRSYWPSELDERFQRELHMDWVPKVDVKDATNALTVHAELPGMKKEDINIDIDEKNHLLTLSGEHKKEEEKKEENYYLSERSYGRFERRFRLPENTDANAIKANLRNGVLDIVIPKSAVTQQQPKKISIS